MDYYEILGISRDATLDQIKKAHRKLVQEHHPDKETGNVEKFKEIQEAYEALSEPHKRSFYDEYGLGDERLLYDIFAKLVQECLKEGADPMYFVGAIDDKIDASIAHFAALETKVLNFKKKLLEALDHLKMIEKGSDMVKWGMLENLKGIEAELANYRHELTVFRAAEVVMKKYASNEEQTFEMNFMGWAPPAWPEAP